MNSMGAAAPAIPSVGGDPQSLGSPYAGSGVRRALDAHARASQRLNFIGRGLLFKSTIQDLTSHLGVPVQRLLGHSQDRSGEEVPEQDEGLPPPPKTAGPAATGMPGGGTTPIF